MDLTSSDGASRAPTSRPNTGHFYCESGLAPLARCGTKARVRSVDWDERALLRSRGINVIDMRLIDECGVGVLLRSVLDTVAAASGLLHVSLDVNFLDPSLAPGGGHGPGRRHLPGSPSCDGNAARLRAGVSLDVVELNPFLDVRGRSALLLVDLIGSLFGRQIIERETDPVRSA